MAAIPSSLRRMNERTIIGHLRRLGSASRADLAKVAGMSQPTVGKITHDLLHLGILQEVEGIIPSATNGQGNSGRLGRPGRLLRLNGDRPRFIAVQVGVAQTSLAALPVSVTCDDRWPVSFPTPENPEEWLRQLRHVATQLPGREMWGVLISVPGIVDEAAGKVLFSPNLHWTERVSLPDLVQEVWQAPTLLVQEIRALALGQLAALPSVESFLLVDFGQGVGGAIVESGRLHRNPLPLNGELGHTPILGNQRRCGCGATGCVETLISRRGLLASFAAAHPAAPPTWAGLVEHVARRGVEPWLGQTLEAAAVVIAGALNVLGLRQVIITGSLTELSSFVIEHLSSAIARGTMWARFGDVTCRSAPRRRAAGLVGSAIDRLLVPAGVSGRPFQPAG